jgi:hypothetical protein
MTNEDVMLARRAACGLAAQVAQGNAEEFSLLMRLYVEEAAEAGVPQGPALGLLANVAIGLAVLAHDSDVEWFQETAMTLAVES